MPGSLSTTALLAAPRAVGGKRGTAASESTPPPAANSHAAVSAAAACATLDVIAEEGLLANATARGAQLQAGLWSISSRFPSHIADVRGRGCMVGLEFNHPAGSGFAAAVTAACMEHGLLLLTTGWRETIRFIPPLVASELEMAQALDMFERGLGDVVKAWKGEPGMR